MHHHPLSILLVFPAHGKLHWPFARNTIIAGFHIDSGHRESTRVLDVTRVGVVFDSKPYFCLFTLRARMCFFLVSNLRSSF